MRNYRVRAVVQPRIPLLVPRIHVREAEVAAALLDEQRRDHVTFRFFFTFGLLTFRMWLGHTINFSAPQETA